MDFLNKAYGQVADLFRSMTPAARLTTGLLAAVIGISLLFLFRQQTDTANELIFGGRTLTDVEIADMSAALSQEDLNGWETEGNQMRVPRGQRHIYIAALAKNNALPQGSGSETEKMFAAHNLWENRKMGEERVRYAKEKELAFTIRKFPGIESASVSIHEIMSDGFRPRKQVRAAVAVKASGNAPLDANQVRMIRDVVAFGGGIDRSDVVIADTNAGRSYDGPPKDGAISGDQNVYADTQRRYEQDFKQKIVDKLSVYPNTNVEVYVELDQTLEDRTTQLKYDEKPTLLKSRTASTDEKSTTSPNAGRPGVEPNIGSNRAIAVSSTPETENTVTESVEETENATGVTQHVTRKSPLAPLLVTASIGIPRSYFKQVWKQQNPTPDGTEPTEPTPTELQAIETQVITEIEQQVVRLIPPAPPGVDTFPRVKVTPYTDLPMPEPPVPSLAETAGAWFASNWQTLAMLGVGLFGVVFLRGMIQSSQGSAMGAVETKTDDARYPAELTPGNEDSKDNKDEDDDGVVFSNSLRGRFQASGRSLRDELTELVREDPDGAASVLQNWITEADTVAQRQPARV
jgi:flagellar M-ring protein FliF